MSDSEKKIEDEYPRLKVFKERLGTATNPEFGMSKDMFSRVEDVLNTLAQDLEGTRMNDIYQPLIRGQIEALGVWVNGIYEGRYEATPNLHPAPPYIKAHGEQPLVGYHLGKFKTAPESNIFWNKFFEAFNVVFPDNMTFEKFIESENRKHQAQKAPGKILPNSTEWTFPTKIPGVAIDGGHFYPQGNRTDYYASPGISVVLAFRPEVIEETIAASQSAS